MCNPKAYQALTGQAPVITTANAAPGGGYDVGLQGAPGGGPGRTFTKIDKGSQYEPQVQSFFSTPAGKESVSDGGSKQAGGTIAGAVTSTAPKVLSPVFSTGRESKR